MTDDLLNDLNPDQRKAVTHTDGPVLILAGAGSGKTRVLTYRVAYLIAQNQVSAHNILMVTFTNKAANAMKERIRAIVKTKELPYAGTFHSLCAKILRIDGKHINLSSNFVIYDDSDQIDAIKTVMKKFDISIKNYNPEPYSRRYLRQK